MISKLFNETPRTIFKIDVASKETLLVTLYKDLVVSFFNYARLYIVGFLLFI